MGEDLELLDRWRAGDQTSGQALFERHFVAVRRFFRNKVGDSADDLTQQVFVGCLDARDRFRGDSSFRTFLFGIAHNVLGKYWRGRVGDDALDLDSRSVHDLGPGPFTELGRRQEHRLLAAALRRLPVQLQVTLELHYWEGLSTSEIAEATGAPHGTVKTRIRKARELLTLAIAELAESSELREITLGDLDRWVAEVGEQARAVAS